MALICMKAIKNGKELITYNTMYNLNIRGVVIVNEENKVLTYGESDYLDFEDVDNSFWFHETWKRAAGSAGLPGRKRKKVHPGQA